MEQTNFMEDVAQNKEHHEGALTKRVEEQTAKIPSGMYLGLAIGSMAISLAFALSKSNKGLANFVGLWAPSLLIMGLYNKLVKLEGSDRRDILH